MLARPRCRPSSGAPCSITAPIGAPRLGRHSVHFSAYGSSDLGKSNPRLQRGPLLGEPPRERRRGPASISDVRPVGTVRVRGSPHRAPKAYQEPDGARKRRRPTLNPATVPPLACPIRTLIRSTTARRRDPRTLKPAPLWVGSQGCALAYPRPRRSLDLLPKICKVHSKFLCQARRPPPTGHNPPPRNPPRNRSPTHPPALRTGPPEAPLTLTSRSDNQNHRRRRALRNSANRATLFITTVAKRRNSSRETTAPRGGADAPSRPRSAARRAASHNKRRTPTCIEKQCGSGGALLSQSRSGDIPHVKPRSPAKAAGSADRAAGLFVVAWVTGRLGACGARA